jgi:WD40 repeat protein
MRRRQLILALLLGGFCLLGNGCDKKQEKGDTKTHPSAANSLSPAEMVIVGKWRLDRHASAAENMANATMKGGIGYEFKPDGTGLRRLGIAPADAITWKMVSGAADSINLTVTEDRPSGVPTAVDISILSPDQIRINNDVVGKSVLQRTTDDISLPQPEVEPEIASMKPAFSLDTAMGTGIKLAASSDGTELISRIGMAAQRNFSVWDMVLRKPAFTLNLAGGEVLPVAMSGDGKLCATADINGVTLYNAHSGAVVRTLAPRPGQGGTPVGLAFSSTNKLVVMAAGRYVIAWSVQTGDEQFSIKADPAEVSAMALLPTSRRVATAASDGNIKIWGMTDGNLIQTLNTTEKNPATAIAISPDGHYLASAHLLGRIAIFDLSIGTLDRSIDPHHPRIESMVFMPDSKTLIHPVHSSTWDIALTDVQSGDMRELLKGHLQSVTSLALGADGNTLFSAGDDPAIKGWDLKGLNRP